MQFRFSYTRTNHGHSGRRYNIYNTSKIIRIFEANIDWLLQSRGQRGVIGQYVLSNVEADHVYARAPVTTETAASETERKRKFVIKVSALRKQKVIIYNSL